MTDSEPKSRNHSNSAGVELPGIPRWKPAGASPETIETTAPEWSALEGVPVMPPAAPPATSIPVVPQAPRPATSVSAATPVRESRSVPSARAALLFGVFTAVGVVVVLALAVVFALTDHPFRTAILMGCGVASLGLLRGLWPGQPWFASRSRWWDVAVYVIVGLAIIWLAPSTATILHS